MECHNKKKEIATFTGHTNNVNSVVFSPDGKTLASGRVDDTVRLWNVFPYMNGEDQEENNA